MKDKREISPSLVTKIRTDPKFALEVYSTIKSQKSRDIFVKQFGMPPGAESVPSLLN